MRYNRFEAAIFGREPEYVLKYRIPLKIQNKIAWATLDIGAEVTCIDYKYLEANLSDLRNNKPNYTPVGLSSTEADMVGAVDLPVSYRTRNQKHTINIATAVQKKSQRRHFAR